MREYGKHRLYEYVRIALRPSFKWSAMELQKKKKEKMIDRFHGGHDQARDTEHLSDDPRYHRSFVSVRYRRSLTRRLVMKFLLPGITRHILDLEMLKL